jgi:hypothetical protein
LQVNIHNPVTEADWQAATLYSRRRHLREYRDCHYATADRALRAGDTATHDLESRKAWAIEEQIEEINQQLETWGIW